MMHRHHDHIDHSGADHNHGACSVHAHWAGGSHDEGVPLEESTAENDPLGWPELKVEQPVVVLKPAENIALTIARGQIERGVEVPPNTTAMLVLALDRVTGRSDWSA
jgi:hypothetical protein